ncbi:MAG: LysM peptidoglycan-binding domain-containing protein [Steroidobacterales bacterium]
MQTKHSPWVAIGISMMLMAGCQTQRPFVPPSSASIPDNGVQGTVVGDERTSLEAAADSAGNATTSASPAPRIALAPNAPDTYVVKSGDTLWGIAKTFLRDPWLWPEIWQVNPQVQNPHLIYPGDTLRLVYIDGQPRLVLERGSGVHVLPKVRSEPREAPIRTIPFQTVAAFMSKPSVLTREQINAAGYLLASRDDHEAIGEGNTIYARGLRDAEVGRRFSIVRIGDVLRDPDDNSVLGYNGIYTGSGRVTRMGDPTTLIMTDSARESEKGDKVLPSNVDIALDFLPSPPKNNINGRIMAVTDGVTTIGQFQVVVINRGARDGLVPGNVLAVYQAGPLVADQQKHGFMGSTSSAFSEKVRLPDERSGTFMVFKTYDRLSYGLIMEAKDIIKVKDRVANP